jgi:hypothetical protein
MEEDEAPPAKLEAASVALKGVVQVPTRVEQRVQGCLGDETQWDLDVSLKCIKSNMQGKQLRTVSETYQKILGGNNKVGVEPVEADELDIVLVWIIMPAAVVFNSYVIWTAGQQAMQNGSLYEMMVQAVELFLLGANLVPLLFTLFNILLRKHAKAEDVVGIISLGDAVGKLSLFRFVIFLKPQNNPVLWMVRQGLGDHGISTQRKEIQKGSIEKRCGACLMFLMMIGPYVFLACVVPALALMSWFIKLNLLSSVFSTPITTWSMADYIAVAGFLNQVAGMADNDRMQREAIYLFLFAGSDGRWDASSFMELTGAKALGHVFGVNLDAHADGPEEAAMNAFRAGIVHYMVKRDGWINGVALFYAMKATHLQHFLVSEQQEVKDGEKKKKPGMERGDTIHGDLLAELGKYSNSTTDSTTVTFFQDHENRYWETPQVSNHSTPNAASAVDPVVPSTAAGSFI